MPPGLGNYPDPRYLGPLIGASRPDFSPVPVNIPDAFRAALALRAGGTGSTLADVLNAGTNLGLGIGQSIQDTNAQKAAQNLAASQSSAYGQALRTGTVPQDFAPSSPDDALKLQQLFASRADMLAKNQPFPSSAGSLAGLTPRQAPAVLAAAKLGNAQDAAADKTDAAQAKADKQEWNQITQKENPMWLGQRSNAGVAWRLMQKARQAMQVLSNPGVTNEQINASNADLGSIYTGGNAVEKNIFETLQYHTLQDRYKRFMTFFTSEPQAAANPYVVNALKQNLQDIGSVSQDLINRAVQSSEIDHADYISKHPSQWAAHKQNILGGISFNVPSWPQGGGAPQPSGAPQNGGWQTNRMANTIIQQIKSGVLSPEAGRASLLNLKNNPPSGQ